MTIPGSNPGCRGGEPVTSRLSYGAACHAGLTSNLLIYINLRKMT
jgi:hypothetical protein